MFFFINDIQLTIQKDRVLQVFTIYGRRYYLYFNVFNCVQYITVHKCTAFYLNYCLLKYLFNTHFTQHSKYFLYIFVSQIPIDLTSEVVILHPRYDLLLIIKTNLDILIEPTNIIILVLCEIGYRKLKYLYS